MSGNSCSRTRLERLHVILQKNKLNGILVSHQPNITYLTGFQSSDSYLLITPKGNFFITDSRFYQQARSFFNSAAKESSKEKNFSNRVNSFNVRLNGKSVFNTISKLALDSRVKRLGFEARSLDVAQFHKIKRLLRTINFISTQELIEDLRKIKEPQELIKIKRAVDISVQALRYAQSIIHPGLAEIEIAAELERFIRYQGARTTSFETIIASGQNSTFHII